MSHRRSKTDEGKKPATSDSEEEELPPSESESDIEDEAELVEEEIDEVDMDAETEEEAGGDILEAETEAEVGAKAKAKGKSKPAARKTSPHIKGRPPRAESVASEESEAESEIGPDVEELDPDEEEPEPAASIAVQAPAGDKPVITQDEPVKNSTEIVIIVPDEQRRTSHIMSLSEFTEAISLRTEQIGSDGTQGTMLDEIPLGITSARDLAIAEIRARRCPLKLCRNVGRTIEGGVIKNYVEMWSPNVMTHPPFQ